MAHTSLPGGWVNLSVKKGQFLKKQKKQYSLKSKITKINLQYFTLFVSYKSTTLLLILAVTLYPYDNYKIW